MAQTLRGLAVIWGAGGITSTGVIINDSTPTCKTQSIDASRDSDVFQVADANGEVCAEAFFNEKIVISIDVVPIAAASNGLAQVLTNAANLFPAPGDTITITDAQSTITDANHSGKYSVISATMKRSNTGVAICSLQIRQYKAYDVTAAVS